MIGQDVNIFRYQPKRGIRGSVKQKRSLQVFTIPIGVGVNICCDLQKKTFTVSNFTFMITEKKTKYQKYITSQEWYDLKIDLLKIRGCKCEKCGKKKRPTGLHIHHLTYVRLFKEKAEDLLILCPTCHMKIHGLFKEKQKVKVLKSKSYKRRKNKKSPLKTRQHAERVANEKFTGAKRRRMKGKSLPAWQQ